jgi:hypothetical protein
MVVTDISASHSVSFYHSNQDWWTSRDVQCKAILAAMVVTYCQERPAGMCD